MSDSTGQRPDLVAAEESRVVVTGIVGPDSPSSGSALRQKMLMLLDELENASPFESARIAEQVRRQAGQMRALRNGNT